jgi:hypothetical protein
MRLAAAVLLLSCIVNGCAAQIARHETSCGPRALSAAYATLGIETTPSEVSREIRANSASGNLWRSLLGMFCPEGFGITWPGEIEISASARGVRAVECDGIPDGPGVLLLKTGWMSHHYVATPLRKRDAGVVARSRLVSAWRFELLPTTHPTTKPSPPEPEVIAVNASLQGRAEGFRRGLDDGEVGVVFYVDSIENEECAVLDSGERVSPEVVLRVARAKWPGRPLWMLKVPLPLRVGFYGR